MRVTAISHVGTVSKRVKGGGEGDCDALYDQLCGMLVVHLSLFLLLCSTVPPCAAPLHSRSPAAPPLHVIVIDAG